EAPAELAAFLRERTGGNPFYSEQLLLGLRDAGHLVVEGPRCRLARHAASLEALEVPGSLEGIIVGRLDLLSPSQQLALKVASVIGRVFRYLVLAEVYPVAAGRQQLPEQLADLCRRQLIAPETGREKRLADDGGSDGVVESCSDAGPDHRSTTPPVH